MFIKNQFYGVIETASNIGTQTGNYTAEMFLADFPQFSRDADNETRRSWVPSTVLDQFIAMANVTIQPDKWLDQWRYACGLYVAHNATLYLKTFSCQSDSPAAAAATGDIIGNVKSATLGDASVTYDAESVIKGTADWGDLNATVYGQILATKARLVGMGGSYAL